MVSSPHLATAPSLPSFLGTIDPILYVPSPSWTPNATSETQSCFFSKHLARAFSCKMWGKVLEPGQDRESLPATFFTKHSPA